MTMTRNLLPIALLSATLVNAQYSPPDPSGLEGILVERYYVSDANDAADTDGSSDLTTGEVTYRVFVDLKAGYKLITVGGFPGHEFTLNTTTSFFYNDDRGESWGDDINDIHLTKNTVMLDSWLSMGAASDAHWGVMKDEDTDGSVQPNNDGGSAGGAPLLANADPLAGIPLSTADGLLSGTPSGVLSVGVAPTILNDYGGANFASENFAWSSNQGNIAGPTATNRILVGQFTTDGDLTFCMNLWVRIPDSLVCSDPNCHEILEYYATIIPSDTLGGGFQADNKFTHPTLCFDSSTLQSDCLGVPGGGALPGTPCDDGNSDTSNDVFDATCNCLGEDCLGTVGGSALPGTPCDDGDPDTANDTWQTGCVCTGSVGVAEAGAPGALITVQPNPVRDRAQVRIDNATGNRAALTLRNTLGQVVLNRDLGQLGGTWNGMVDMHDQVQGLYFLEVELDGRRMVRRIIKH